jgi:hypothetical protein
VGTHVGGGVLDQFFVALGISVDTTGLKQLKTSIGTAKASMVSMGGSIKSSLLPAAGAANAALRSVGDTARSVGSTAHDSLLSVGNAVKVFIGGLALHEIADIGSTFEQNRIQIAGFLAALGQSPDFKAGLVDAEKVIAKITKDAALLPGEAEEYIEVFKGGLPFIQGAMPGGSLDEMVDFSNQLTAIGKTFKLDAGLIAREFDHMLSPGRGTAGLRLPLFRSLLPFMKKVEGQANLNAEAFNAMSAPDRLKLMQKTFVQLQPMLDASADSFDAMWGSAKSMVKTVTRLATTGIFEGMKRGLKQLSAMFIKSDGSLTDLGQRLVDTARNVGNWIVQIASVFGTLVMWFAKSEAGATALKLALTLVGLALTGLALTKTIGLVKDLTKGVANLKMVLIGGLVVALLLVAEDIYRFVTGSGRSLTGLFAEKFPTAFAITEGALAAFAVAAAAYFAFAFWPLTLALGVIAGVILALNELDKKFDIVNKVANGVYDAFGWERTHTPEALAATNAEPGFTRTEDPDHPSFLNTPDANRTAVSHRPKVLSRRGGGMHLGAEGWNPGQTPAAAGGAAGASDSHDMHIHGPVTVVADNPKEFKNQLGREATRNAASVGY